MASSERVITRNSDVFGGQPVFRGWWGRGLAPCSNRFGLAVAPGFLYERLNSQPNRLSHLGYPLTPSAKILPGNPPRGVPVYIRMEEPRRFRDATLVRIRQPDRTGDAALPVAHEKGRDPTLWCEFCRMAFPSRVRDACDPRAPTLPASTRRVSAVPQKGYPPGFSAFRCSPETV